MSFGGKVKTFHIYPLKFPPPQKKLIHSWEIAWYFKIEFYCNFFCWKIGYSQTMAEARRRAVALGGIALNDDAMIISESSPTRMTDVESVRKKLRQRWELASVLNFLHVTTLFSFIIHDFDPLIFLFFLLFPVIQFLSVTSSFLLYFICKDDAFCRQASFLWELFPLS